MQAADFNRKYDQVLNAFGLLRKRRATSLKWGIRESDRFQESCRLFLYLRTLARYLPGVNLTDCELAILFHNALTLISSLDFLEYEAVIPRPIGAPADCDCNSGLTLPEIIRLIGSGGGGGASGSSRSPFTIFYQDINWNAEHTIYTQINWSGLNYRVMNNTGNRFLNSAEGFQILTTGGFSLTTPMYDGQEFIAIF